MPTRAHQWLPRMGGALLAGTAEHSDIVLDRVTGPIDGCQDRGRRWVGDGWSDWLDCRSLGSEIEVSVEHFCWRIDTGCGRFGIVF